MSVKLEGNIVVTGCNRGIGLELVRQLAEKTTDEAHVYACCRDPDGDGAEALRAIAAQHVSSEDSVAAAVGGVSRRIGGGALTLLINNAAVNKPATPAPLSATTKQDMMDVYETNVAGPFLLAKMFLPLLRKAAAGRDEGDEMSCRRSAVINISTLISSIEKCPETFHVAQMYPYRSSKAALNMLTRCQAEDFKAHNILVAAVHPGWVRTDMGGEEAPLTTQESVREMLQTMSSLGDKDNGMLVDWQGNRIPW